jgi:hypothetical protein
MARRNLRGAGRRSHRRDFYAEFIGFYAADVQLLALALQASYAMHDQKVRLLKVVAQFANTLFPARATFLGLSVLAFLSQRWRDVSTQLQQRMLQTRVADDRRSTDRDDYPPS